MAGMTWIIRTLRWHRRTIAAALAALGTLALVSQLSASGEATSPVVVTTSAVAAGAPIVSSSVALRPMPRSSIPIGAITRVGDVLGHPVAVALTAGTIIQPGLLVSGSPVQAGRALVPVTVKDGQLRDLLSPGLRIALVSAGGDVPGIITDDAVVHSMPPAASTSFVASGQSALILVEVPSALAPEVAVLGQSGQISVFLTGAP